MRYLILFLISCSFLFLISCGNSTPGGYLYKDNNSAMFIQFTNKNGQISGNIEEIAETNDTPPSTKSFSEAITGSQNGSSLTLTISYFGISESFVGIDNGDTLNLDIPQSNGSMQSTVFTGASTDDYNQAVSDIHASVTKADILYNTGQATMVAAQENAQVTATAVQATQIEITTKQQAVTNDNTALTNDLQSLQSDSSTLSSFSETSTLGGYANDWQSMQNDYTTEQKDANAGCANNGGSQVQADANQVDADENQMQADDNQFSADTNQYNSDMQPVQNDMGIVQQDWKNLQNDVKANISNTPSPAFTNNDVNTGLSNAQTSITTAHGIMSNAQAGIKQYDQEASALQKTADTLSENMKCS